MFRQVYPAAVSIQSFVLLRIKLPTSFLKVGGSNAATQPAAWRKRLYITMSHNAASASDYYHSAGGAHPRAGYAYSFVRAALG